MLNELDDNNRLIEMQRIEIGRLREQVTSLVDHGSSGGPGGGGSRGGMMIDNYNRNENMDQIGEMPPAFVMSQSQSTPALERFAPQER